MFDNNNDLLSMLSPSFIKELIKTEQALKKEFKINKEVNCMDFNRQIDEV